MTIKQGLGLCTLATLGLIVAQQARAQEINYGALSEMFGEPVTTSATGSPQTASQAPANMLIISADEVRRSGATDIPEILRYYAGIDVRSEGALNNDVSIRGYAQPFNPRLLVLINGRQVYLDDYGYTAWQSLPVQLNDIRQIEVVRGPASALFGFNAASGVINIITYDPLFDKTNVLNFGIGSSGTYTGSLVSTLNEPGKGGITVQLGGLTTQEFNQLPILAGGTVSNRPYEGSYAVDARYKPSAQTEVTLETTKSVANASSEGSVFSYDTSMYRAESYKASVAAATGIGTITLLGYTNQVTASYHSTGATGQNLFDVNQIDVVQLNDLFRVADVHAIKIGFEYRNNRGSGSLFDGSLHYNNFAGNAMWNWQIKPTLSFTAAGRVDHLELLRSDPLSSDDKYVPADYNGTSITTPSYNLGLVWQATQNDTFRLLTGRAVQAPSLLDLGFDLQLPEDGGLIKAVYAGNPNLIPSVSTNYELDYDRQLPQIFSTLRTAVFFNTTRDLMADASALPGTFAYPVFSSYSQNTGSGQAVGGEVGTTGANDLGFRWNANYSLVGVRNKTGYGPPTAPTDFNNATPTSEINFGGGYSWRQWEADAEAHWQSNYQTNTYGYGPAGIFFTPVTVDNYITATARIGYSVNSHITLAVAGQALTQANQNGFGALKPYRRVLFSANFTY